MAKAKAAEAADTVKTRLKETWCYLIYPMQESAQTELEWISAKIPAQDGLLSRASKKLASDEGLFPELGPARLDRELQKYIWNGKAHPALKDLWEYVNRYTYLPPIIDRSVLTKTVQAAVGGMLPGPFAYAARWDEKAGEYIGLVVQGAPSASVVIDADSVIVKPEVAEQHLVAAKAKVPGPSEPVGPSTVHGAPAGGTKATTVDPAAEKKPTRFLGTVMISPDRPAHDRRQIVGAIVEQLTTPPDAEVALRLEIEAEVPSGLDRSKVRTLTENANTLGFIDKVIG